MVIYLGTFHNSLSKEFEYPINAKAPILLFIFKENIKPEIIDMYGDLPDELINEEEPIEGFGDNTTAFFKISSKIAPFASDLMSTKFGLFLKDNFNITFETGYI